MTLQKRLPQGCRFVVAIPACNEEGRIGACLAALGTQRDLTGAPLPQDGFAVLVLANNCRDGTADEARRWAARCAMPVLVAEHTLPPDRSNAGWARKVAMDLAADLLAGTGRADGVICTTDADSAVCSTWMARTSAALDAGVDAVAGYIEAEPGELLALGPAFTARGRLEDTYLACMAEIWALCDPLPHDPWPNHRVASGASFALTADSYHAIGGLPPRPLGEDVALAESLVARGFKIRHPVDLVVRTSCRLDGRAAGGAADTMKLRRDDPDAPCDDEMEPARDLVRRAAWKGRLRPMWSAAGAGPSEAWAARLGLAVRALPVLMHDHGSFEPFWRAVERESPILRRGPALRPSQLPQEIERARAAIRHLRRAEIPVERTGWSQSLGAPAFVAAEARLAEPAVRR